MEKRNEDAGILAEIARKYPKHDRMDLEAAFQWCWPIRLRQHDRRILVIVTYADRPSPGLEATEENYLKQIRRAHHPNEVQLLRVNRQNDELQFNWKKEVR